MAEPVLSAYVLLKFGIIFGWLFGSEFICKGESYEGRGGKCGDYRHRQHDSIDDVAHRSHCQTDLGYYDADLSARHHADADLKCTPSTQPRSSDSTAYQFGDHRQCDHH